MVISLSLIVTAILNWFTFNRLWHLSLRSNDASIVDLYWGLGFSVIGWVAYQIAGGEGLHGYWLMVLTAIWGIRLSLYLFWRNHGHGEDRRYAALRAKAPDTFAQASLFSVFYLQGAAQWLLSLPVQLGQLSDAPLGLWAYLGFLIFTAGLFFEWIGDFQLSRFRADPANAGRVLDQGLWAWSRHPNYFGTSCVWWGITLLAYDGTSNWWLFLSPAALTYLLIYATGIALLEPDLEQRKPDYHAYQQRVSAFWPQRPTHRPSV
jgi:steroid 5-alpha reductase family enzyme